MQASFFSYRDAAVGIMYNRYNRTRIAAHAVKSGSYSRPENHDLRTIFDKNRKNSHLMAGY